VIPLSAVSLYGFSDALPCLIRIAIPVQAYLFLSQSPVETLNSPYGLRVAKGDTPVTYAQLGASLLKGS